MDPLQPCGYHILPARDEGRSRGVGPAAVLTPQFLAKSRSAPRSRRTRTAKKPPGLLMKEPNCNAAAVRLLEPRRRGEDMTRQSWREHWAVSTSTQPTSPNIRHVGNGVRDVGNHRTGARPPDRNFRRI